MGMKAFTELTCEMIKRNEIGAWGSYCSENSSHDEIAVENCTDSISKLISLQFIFITITFLYQWELNHIISYQMNEFILSWFG